MAIGQFSEAARYLERVTNDFLEPIRSAEAAVAHATRTAAELDRDRYVMFDPSTKSILDDTVGTAAKLFAFDSCRDSIPQAALRFTAAGSTLADVDMDDSTDGSSAVQVSPTVKEDLDLLKACKETAIDLLAVFHSMETGDNDERAQRVAVMQFEFFQDFKHATGFYPDTSDDTRGSERQRSHRK